MSSFIPHDGYGGLSYAGRNLAVFVSKGGFRWSVWGRKTFMKCFFSTGMKMMACVVEVQGWETVFNWLHWQGRYWMQSWGGRTQIVKKEREGKCEDDQYQRNWVSLSFWKAKMANLEIALRRFSQVNDHQHLLLLQINLKAHREAYWTLAQGADRKKAGDASGMKGENFCNWPTFLHFSGFL